MLGSQSDGVFYVGIDKLDEAEACFRFFGAVLEAKDEIREGDDCSDGSSDIGEDAHGFNHICSP